MSNYVSPLHAAEMKEIRRRYRGKKVVEAYKNRDGKLIVVLGMRKCKGWCHQP